MWVSHVYKWFVFEHHALQHLAGNYTSSCQFWAIVMLRRQFMEKGHVQKKNKNKQKSSVAIICMRFTTKPIFCKSINWGCQLAVSVKCLVFDGHDHVDRRMSTASLFAGWLTSVCGVVYSHRISYALLLVSIATWAETCYKQPCP